MKLSSFHFHVKLGQRSWLFVSFLSPAGWRRTLTVYSEMKSLLVLTQSASFGPDPVLNLVLGL